MSQKEINEAEWRDPANWRGGWLGLYRSERDTRVWVPKRIPWMGFTVNFAHLSGVLTVLLILAVGLGVALVAILAER